MTEWISELTSGIGTSISQALTDFWNVITDSIWSKFFQYVYYSVFGAISEVFEMIGNFGAKLFELEWVTAYIQFFKLFGWALFVAGFAVAVFDTAIEYQSMERINIKRQILPFLWGFLAVNLFTVVPIKLYSLCVNLQGVFMDELAALGAENWGAYYDGKGIMGLGINILNGFYTQVSFTNFLFGIAVAYCILKVFFANIKRSGILLIQIAIGSLYMFAIPKGNTDGFVQWMRQVIALCVTAFLQTTLLYLGLMTFIATDTLLGLGLMLAANEVPEVAKMFGMDTSVKVNIASSVSTVSTAVNLTRAVAKK